MWSEKADGEGKLRGLWEMSEGCMSLNRLLSLEILPMVDFQRGQEDLGLSETTFWPMAEECWGSRFTSSATCAL